MGSGVSGIAFNTQKAIQSKYKTLDELKQNKVVPEGWEWIPGNNTAPLKIGAHILERFNKTNKIVNLNYLSESTPAYDILLNATAGLFETAMHGKHNKTGDNGTVSTAAASPITPGVASGATSLPSPLAPSAEVTGAQSMLYSALGVLPKIFTGEPIITQDAIQKLGSLGSVPLGNGVVLPLDKISDITKLGSQLNQLAGTVKQETQGLNHLAGIAAQIQKLREQTFEAARQAAAGGADAGAGGLAAAAKQAATALGGVPAGSATAVNGVLKKSATVAIPARVAAPAAAPALPGFRPSVPKPTGPVLAPRPVLPAPAVPRPAVPRPGSVVPAGLASAVHPAVPRPVVPALSSGSLFASGYRGPSVAKPIPKPVAVASTQPRAVQYTRIGK
jgi:hypothetical protein